MRPPTMTSNLRRWSAVMAVVAGVLASLVLGAGVLALLSDTVIVEDNELTTGTRDSAMNLEVADLRAGQCDEFGDGPIAGRVSSAGVDAFQDGLLFFARYCLANRSRVAGVPSVTVTNIVSLEAGPCTPDEIRFGDTTCGDGDAGELLAQPTLTVSGQGPGCQIPLGPGDAADDRIAPGSVCLVDVSIEWVADLDELGLVLAQTDVLQYDLEFTLVDPDNELPDPPGR